VRGGALEQLRDRGRQLRAVETRGRVDEHEVGLVRAREPDEVAHAVVAREGRRPRVRPVVREPLDRDDAVRVQQQDRQRRPLPRPAESHRAVLGDDLERSQHAELEHGRDGSRSVAAR
jgi:hypothetical protein